MDVHISEQFVASQFKMYDGTTDLEAHIKTFSNAMAFRTGNDAIWCLAFSLSLEGKALEWFNYLPSNSIENFAGLQRLFNQQFTANSTQDLTVFELVTLKQGKEETLRAFMDRYQKTVRQVKGLSLKLSLHYILPALKPGPFKDSGDGRNQGGRNETVIQKGKSGAQGGKDEWGKIRHFGGKPGSLKHKEPRRGPRFQQYTPLNAPREKILREALSTKLLLEPMKRPTPPGADGTKHCLYHKNMGHTTEECVTLKDKIEELIRAGQLKQYVRVDRPPTPAERPSPRHAYRHKRSGSNRIDRPRSKQR
ncbi:uncharacterized protein LOC124834942 [Vigna umbellata]|uniref:uncharacterized protein LOC124834942 n=1 Tax=Vigna umbellata TaxID=87088 RepID=UPI001F5F2F4E|nr:uncharacterized protein LOC124834942 [Vigna umbellata]